VFESKKLISIFIIMNEVERKEYFKEYYLKSKKKDEDKDVVKVKRKRGRPKKIVPQFKITRFDEPYLMTW